MLAKLGPHTPVSGTEPGRYVRNPVGRRGLPHPARPVSSGVSPGGRFLTRPRPAGRFDYGQSRAAIYPRLSGRFRGRSPAGPENREASRLYLRRGDLSRAVRYRASEESGTVRQVTGKVSPVSGDLQREELSGAGATAGIQSGRRQAAPYVVEGPGGFTRYSPIRAGFVFRPDPDCQSKPTLTPCSLPGVMVLVRRQPAHQTMSLDNIDLAP